MLRIGRFIYLRFLLPKSFSGTSRISRDSALHRAGFATNRHH
jgi:hypothetical protein